MKKSFLAGVLVSLAILTSVPAVASDWWGGQSAAKKRPVVHTDAGVDSNYLGFQFGPEVGNTSISVPVGATAVASSTRTRPMFGLYYERMLIPYLGLRGGFDYVQRGFSQSDGQGAAIRQADVAANYIELPVLVKGQYRFGMATPYVLTGPFLGLLIGKGSVVSQGGKQTESGLDNQLNDLNFGWNIGAGTTLELARHFNLDFNMRYSAGIINVYQALATGTSIRLNSFQFLTGLSVGI